MTNLDFVGSHSGPSTCTWHGQTIAFNHDHEGHSGAKATDYAKYGNATGWLQKAKPDVVLLHVGTNDAVAGTSSDGLLQAYDTLLGEMRTENPGIQLMLSQLIPIDPARYSQGAADRIRSYNGAMSEWAEKKNKTDSPVTVVDAYAGFDFQTMTRDGKHPNEAGDAFLAERYAPAIRRALGA